MALVVVVEADEPPVTGKHQFRVAILVQIGPEGAMDRSCAGECEVV